MSKQVTAVLAAIVTFAVGWFLTALPTSNAPTNSNQSAMDWQLYENNRFGYQLSRPTTFTVEQTPQNNDGRVFARPSSSTTVRVFGRQNINNEGLSALVGKTTQSLRSLRDAEVGSSSAVLYGNDRDGSQIIKILHSTDTIATLEVMNPEAELTETERNRLLASFQWSQQTDDQPATSSDQRPVSFTPESAQDLIRVEQPVREARITSPLQITGQARGQWFFEADAPVVLTDWDGRIIAEGYIQAEDDWMTEEFVPFSGTLEFSPPADTGPQSVRGSLIIRRANPSGQSDNDMAVEIPVRFQQ
jgi:hypothetical protein